MSERGEVLVEQIMRDGPGPVRLGGFFPNFKVTTTTGEFLIHNYFKDSWNMLFSYPENFTPVGTTELARVFALQKEFADRNCKVIALSCDTIESQREWQKDIQSFVGAADSEFFPIISDMDRTLAIELQMLDPNEKDEMGIPITANAVYIIDPAKKMRASFVYPATTGRNFDEILRLLDSLQICDKDKATPEGWKKGEDVMIQPHVSDKDCERLFPAATLVEMPSGKKYFRKTPLLDM